MASLVCAVFGAGSLFFAWYTVRLAWINLTLAGVTAHRQAGMYIGAVIFPLAAVVFGYLAKRCYTLARGKRY